MLFLTHYKKPEDCILGKKLCGMSQERPRVNEKIILSTNAQCCIEKEAEQNIKEAENELIRYSFAPHHKRGDYISGSTLWIKNAEIQKQKRKSHKRTQHRIHTSIFDALKNKIAICYIEHKSFMSPSVHYNHKAKLEEIIKIIQ